MMTRTCRHIAAVVGISVIGYFPCGALATSVKFSWAGYQACSSRSPAFVVFDVPTATTRLAFKMIDKRSRRLAETSASAVVALSKDQCGAIWQRPLVMDNFLYQKLEFGGLTVEHTSFGCKVAMSLFHCSIH